MSNVFSRSWEVTRLSFNVLKSDKELLLFPFLSGIFSILFIIAMIFPSLSPYLAEESGAADAAAALNYLIIFGIYLGLSFIATFFNVCTVYTVKTRFMGQDATLGQSFGFAFSRIHLIFMWSLVSATFGLLLRIIDNIAERMGAIGQILLGIVTWLLGMAWSIITLFVVPSMVYHDLGPIAAIKKSIETLKKTWGESLIRHYALGMMQFVFVMLGVFIFAGLAIFMLSIEPLVSLVAFIVGILYLVLVVLVFSVANSIFNTALYVYADTGRIPTGFTQEVVQQAFEAKKPSLFGGRTSQPSSQASQRPAFGNTQAAPQQTFQQQPGSPQMGMQQPPQDDFSRPPY